MYYKKTFRKTDPAMAIKGNGSLKRKGAQADRDGEPLTEIEAPPEAGTLERGTADPCEDPKPKAQVKTKSKPKAGAATQSKGESKGQNPEQVPATSKAKAEAKGQPQPGPGRTPGGGGNGEGRRFGGRRGR